MTRELMMTGKHLSALLLLALLAMTVCVSADVSLKKAVEIGEKNIKNLTDQSYHYRIEYDTILALPVHSKTIWKNDFYLLYFLKDNQFQAEVEVDKKTGDPTLLALDKMSRPYYELLHNQFCHLYFSVDSMMAQGLKRFRLEQDSVRLVYYGVIPKLGKRGVVWELHSAEGLRYVTPGGLTLLPKQILRDMNTRQMEKGNYLADSLKLAGLVDEISRLRALDEQQLGEVKLTAAERDTVIVRYKSEMQKLYGKFPDMRKKIYLPEDAPKPDPADTLKQRPRNRGKKK